MSTAPLLLSVEGLSKSYGGVHAVREVSFGLRAGEILALIGPNGAGKSTCFDMLNGQKVLIPAASICSVRKPPGRSRARSGSSASGVPSRSPRHSRP